MLHARPERYKGSDRKYTLADLLQLESLDQLISKAIDDEIDQEMRKSHEEQVAFFEKVFDVQIKKHYENWPKLIEIFERRNLAAHASLIVNAQYHNKLSIAGSKDIPKIGEKLKIDGDYLVSAIDKLIEFCLMIGISAWQKQFPNQSSQSFDALVELSYNILCDSHPDIVEHLLLHGLKVKSRGATEAQIKMMVINLSIAYKLNGKKADSNRILEETDWSACGPHFNLCRHAIIENIEECLKYLEPSRSGQFLDMRCIREWPAFQWVRSNEKFKAAVEAVFGEPLSPIRLIEDASVDDDQQQVPLIATTVDQENPSAGLR